MAIARDITRQVVRAEERTTELRIMTPRGGSAQLVATREVVSYDADGIVVGNAMMAPQVVATLEGMMKKGYKVTLPEGIELNPQDIATAISMFIDLLAEENYRFMEEQRARMLKEAQEEQARADARVTNLARQATQTTPST